MNSQPLKWHGGKSYLAARIIAMMPRHTRYVEPFFGGGAVLFRKPCEGVAEFVNDLDGELTNFWRVLRTWTQFTQLRQICEATPLSADVFREASERLAQPAYSTFSPGKSNDEIQRAWAFFVRYRQSRQGLGKDFCTPTRRTRRGMNENVSAWLSAVDSLPDAHARLRRVEIWNTDAVECVRKLDSPDTLFYCDPPYLHETRSTTGEYRHEMAAEDHTQLLDVLTGVSGKFLLSGYPSSLYESFAGRCGWHRTDFAIDNKASGAKTKQVKTECVWTNYRP